MKEIVNVSIAGISFSFSVDAYEKLKAYLDTLNSGYAKNPDAQEIISDIEARIAEIILSKQAAETVVTERLVQSIVDQMGLPDDMTIEEPQPMKQFPRRLYRNSDGQVLGGVCSGLGTFFDVSPVWFRVGIFAPLLLMVMFSSFGYMQLNSTLGALIPVLILLYFVLWVAVPLARTPRQKLEMNGDPITASAIERTLSQEMGRQQDPRSNRSASVFAQLMTAVGQILLFFIKAIVFLVGIAVLFGVAFFIVAIVVVALGLGGAGVMLSALNPVGGISMTLMIVLVLISAVLPLIAISHLIVAALFKVQVKRGLLGVIAGIWLLIIIFCGIMLIGNLSAVESNLERIFEKKGLTIIAPHDNDHNTDASRRVQVVELDDEGNQTIVLEKDILNDSTEVVVYERTAE